MSRARTAAGVFPRILVLTLCASTLLGGCGWLSGRTKPAWIEGRSTEFSPSQFVLGEGQGASKPVATDQAYAAVARVFKAEIAAQAKDWESYVQVDNRGGSQAERRLTLEQITRVSTDKVLENVKVLDAWYDAQSGVHHVLAGLQRGPGEAALLEKVRELDQAVDGDVREARQSPDKLAKARGLRRALKNLVLREAYNADLRVIRLSGQGEPAAYQVHALTAELEQFLAAHVRVAVEVTGDHVDPVAHALAEGLIREGLTIHQAEAREGSAPDVLVRALVRVWPLDVRDPQFTYVRWCGDVEIVEPASRRVVGAVSRGGREGHLTEREAAAKALRVIQQEFSGDLAKTIASHVFGEAPLPASMAQPAGCPREGGPATLRTF